MNFIYLDYDLATVWPRPFNEERVYDLFVEFETYWQRFLVIELNKIYYTKENKYKWYTAKLSHDGQRDCGLLSSKIYNYKKGDHLTEDSWRVLSNFCTWMKHAEVFIDWYNNTQVGNTEK